MISLEHGFQAGAPKEFVTSALSPMQEEEKKLPTSEKEYQDAYHQLRRENEDLKNAIATRDTRITQLEALMGNK